MAVNIKELKPGNAYTENNDLFLCISNEQNKQGRLSGKYMVKRKNMRTSAITEVSYNPTAKVDLALIEKRKMQYLYDSGDMLAVSYTHLMILLIVLVQASGLQRLPLQINHLIISQIIFMMSH